MDLFFTLRYSCGSKLDAQAESIKFHPNKKQTINCCHWKSTKIHNANDLKFIKATTMKCAFNLHKLEMYLSIGHSIYYTWKNREHLNVSHSIRISSMQLIIGFHAKWNIYFVKSISKSNWNIQMINKIQCVVNNQIGELLSWFIKLMYVTIERLLKTNQIANKKKKQWKFVTTKKTTEKKLNLPNKFCSTLPLYLTQLNNNNNAH